jgi:ketosteroid isomerase-like protein
VVVWQKQADGTWKVAVDVPVSDPPEEPATE